MMNWGDHCSSDEEDEEHGNSEQVNAGGDADASEEVELTPDVPTENGEGHNSSDVKRDPAGPRAPRTYDFPTEPPFTSFVGNLAFNIVDNAVLATELKNLAMDTLGYHIEVVDARIMMDRKSDKPMNRGFGYVQVETLDQLKGLMELNNTNAKLAGRKIQLDTANHSNSNNSINRLNRRTSVDSIPNDLDGSRFRGGRFAMNRRNSGRRGDEGGSHGSGGTSTAAATATTVPAADAPAQRPSLKLQPRTKPADAGASSTSLSGTKSNIFGGGKAWDENAWQERRKYEQQHHKSVSDTAEPSVTISNDGAASVEDTKNSEVAVSAELVEENAAHVAASEVTPSPTIDESDPSLEKNEAKHGTGVAAVQAAEEKEQQQQQPEQQVLLYPQRRGTKTQQHQHNTTNQQQHSNRTDGAARRGSGRGGGRSGDGTARGRSGSDGFGRGRTSSGSDGFGRGRTGSGSDAFGRSSRGGGSGSGGGDGFGRTGRSGFGGDGSGRGRTGDFAGRGRSGEVSAGRGRSAADGSGRGRDGSFPGRGGREGVGRGRDGGRQHQHHNQSSNNHHNERHRDGSSGRGGQHHHSKASSSPTASVVPTEASPDANATKAASINVKVDDKKKSPPGSSNVVAPSAVSVGAVQHSNADANQGTSNAKASNKFALLDFDSDSD